MNQTSSIEPRGSAPARPLRGRRRVSLVLLVVILLAGMLIGSGLTVLLRPGPRPSGRRSPEELRDQMTNSFAERLDLTAGQKEQVRSILQARLGEARKLQAEIRPRMKQQAAMLRDQIDGVLTDQQRAEWNAFYTELLQRWFRQPASTQPAEEPPAAEN